MTVLSRLRGRNRFSKGFKMLVAVIVAVTVIYAALLYVTMTHNLAQINREILDTARKNAASLIAFVDHAGFRERILAPQPAIENINYFRSAADDEIVAQLAPPEEAIDAAHGNPFLPGTPMHDFAEQVRLFTQVSFDIEMLLFHVPGNDYYVGAQDGGQSIIVAYGPQAVAGAIRLKSEEVKRLTRQNDLAITSSASDSPILDRIVFSVDIGSGITILLSARQNVMKNTVMNANYGQQFHPVGVALLHEGIGTYWLSDPAGYTDRRHFLELGDSDWEKMPNLYTIQRDGRKFVILNYKMDKAYQFRHVVVIEQSGYLLMNRHNVTLLTLLTLLWILACALIGVILYQEWYTPISRILAQMVPDVQAGGAPPQDEYVAIKSGIEDMHREIDSNHAAISRHRELLRRSMLLRMISSPCAGFSQQVLAQNRLAAFLKRYALAVLLPENPPVGEGEAFQEALRLEEAFLNSRLAPGEEAILLPWQSQAVLLLSSGTKDQKEIDSLLLHCRQAVEKAIASPVRVYANAFASGPSLHTAYTKALLAPTFAYPAELAGPGAAGATLKSRTRLGDTLSLFALLDAHEYVKALKPLAQIVDTAFEDNVSLPLRFALLSGLSADLYCRIAETNESAKDLLDSMPLTYPNAGLAGRDDIVARWETLFLLLEEAKGKSKGYSPLFTQITAYMAEHFQESDLSLTKLSSVFSVGTATISREFKKNCGAGFLESLHRLRIDAAKALIRATESPLKEIALDVGYDNVLTMTRAFKKYEGATPGAFRDQ